MFDRFMHAWLTPPDKGSATPKRPAPPRPAPPITAMQGILDAMRTSRRAVAIPSPCFVPGEVGMPMLREAARHGFRIRLYTKPLASTNEPRVHDKYSTDRAEMLRMGVEIHALSPPLVQRSRDFGALGRLTPRVKLWLQSLPVSEWRL